MNVITEKRSDCRYDCRVPVVCKKKSAFDNAQTIDISRGGVGFISRTFIPLDTKMGLEIALKPDAEPILAMGQVKWVAQVPHSECYRVGMTFADIPSHARSRLEQYFGG